MTDPFERLKASLSDRYVVQRELGRGGMATVYLATDLRHHRDVALKVLLPELASALGPERFLREIELAARLTHPHILPVYDSGSTDEFLYYVMPYVEGESLRDWLNRDKQLPVDDALRISREVTDALSFAHAHGVIHRDIKPENILLEAEHAVVADFGIARAIGEAGRGDLTGTGVAIGTPSYMSPEQAMGSRDVDGRSDLYSLACVLYEMLAGRPPFVGSSVESITYQHLSATPPPITSIRPAVPAHVAATLHRALAKVPADRFNPVALFAEALATGPATAVGAPGPSRATGRRSWRSTALLGAAAVVVVAAAVVAGRGMRPSASGPSEPAHPRTAIAVLPLRNLSPEGPYAYFADGLHDELLTQLSKVASLRVIGRTSVLTYRGTPTRLGQIGDELSVGSIVEGSVQVVGDRLRVIVQLIDPVTEMHLWAERYDRDLDDAFAVQSEIAQWIAAAVGGTLSASEESALTQPPTTNPEAYRFYLQGMEYYNRPGYLRANYQAAQGFFEQAIALDSTFALAYAALSYVHGRMHWFLYDSSPERLAGLRQSAERALRLQPGLPQAHGAMGRVHYVAEGDWRAALAEYHTALEGMPGDAALWNDVAAAQRRLGNWNEALAAVDSVLARDPLRSDILWDLGGSTRVFLRRYPGAVEAFARAYAIAPDAYVAEVLRGWTWVVWQGRTDSLAAILDRLPKGANLGPYGTSDAWVAQRLLWDREADSLLAFVQAYPHPAFASQNSYWPRALYTAWAYRMRHDEEGARREFQSALAHLDSMMATTLPDGFSGGHIARGMALAGLGRREEARREADRIRELFINRVYQYGWQIAAQGCAMVLAQIGDTDAALIEVERLLAGPASTSAHILRIDPAFDPIRNDPRFQALLVKYAEPKPVSRGG